MQNVPVDPWIIKLIVSTIRSAIGEDFARYSKSMSFVTTGFFYSIKVSIEKFNLVQDYASEKPFSFFWLLNSDSPNKLNLLIFLIDLRIQTQFSACSQVWSHLNQKTFFEVKISICKSCILFLRSKFAQSGHFKMCY